MNSPVERADDLVGRLRTAGVPDQSGYVLGTKALTDEAADEIERLRAALSRYGDHLPGCTKRREQLSEFACSCGFSEAVRGGR